MIETLSIRSRHARALPMLAALTAASLLFAMPYSGALVANSRATEVIIDTAQEFRQACTLQAAVISTADGGEVRLAASLEDYFDDGPIDTTRWMTGYARSFYTTPPPFETGGLLNLEGTFVRSNDSFTQTRRFFEARARLRVGGKPTGWPDLGFVREGEVLGEAIEPGQPRTADTAARLFIANDLNDLWGWGRDGVESNPLTWLFFPATDLQQLRVFRIEWEANEARFYLDDAQLPGTVPGVSNLRSWVWLFSLISDRPIQVDWVRAGQYVSAGEAICQIDGGVTTVWNALGATTSAPAGTSIGMHTRTSADGANWSPWAAVQAGAVTSPPGRYLQFRLDLGSADVLRSPEVRRVVINGPLSADSKAYLPIVVRGPAR